MACARLESIVSGQNSKQMKARLRRLEALSTGSKARLANEADSQGQGWQVTADPVATCLNSASICIFASAPSDRQRVGSDTRHQRKDSVRVSSASIVSKLPASFAGMPSRILNVFPGHSAPHLSFLPGRLGGFAADYFRGNPSALRAAGLSGARCSGFGEADPRLITIGELDASRLKCAL
jgi:hypothetical protein